MSIQSLNPVTFPLYGQRLIEASAGTGKTFTIGSLYLRLLLGLGDKQSAHATPLTVDQILVVTFTVAATEELRDRIRGRIHQMRLALQQDNLSDALLAVLAGQITDKKKAIQRLITAEQQMDEASIYTIHGFCQRMLTQNAFESGSLFSSEFVMDESQLRLHVVQDFWRKYFYPLSAQALSSVYQVWSSPQALLSNIQYYLSSQASIISAQMQSDNIEEEIQERLAVISKIKHEWKKGREQALNVKLLAIDAGGKLNGNKYRDKSIPNWVDEIDTWASSAYEALNVPDNLYRFAQDTLDMAMSKGTSMPQVELFQKIQGLRETDLDIKPQLKAFAIHKIKAMLDKVKHKDQVMAFDDLLSRLADALNSDAQQVLAKRIREQYPIAMIDEFQDTDPLQYQIFSTIYQQQPEQDRTSGLFMIGDPKQAIYAFRGADVYTYMQARDMVLDHYNLDTNWRSSAEMIGAVNHLFSRADKPFAESNIPFLPVKARTGADKEVWYLSNQKQKPVTLCYPESQQMLSKTDYESLMTDMTVVRIQQLLEESATGSAYIETEKGKQAIQPQDIAVLVRTGAQGRRVKELLAKQGIASVYLSNRESVFAQDIAIELFHILQAILSPEQESYLRSACATKLFALTADELDRLNQDEIKWQNCVDEFISYKETWLRRGIMPCMRLLLLKRKIPEVLLQRSDGERILTDILHIAELLQEVARQLESENALLHWFNERLSQPNENADAQQLRLESERNLVQIITIHKSKGLEYKFVFLPFACGFREQEVALFHNEEKDLLLDLNETSPMLQHAEQERLAEDLRLIYVALTRAVYACFIGVSDIKVGNKKVSRLLDSAFGYLLLNANAEISLLESIEAVTSSCSSIDSQAVALGVLEQSYQPPRQDVETFNVRKMHTNIEHDWYLTSYSALVHQGRHTQAPLESARFDIDVQNETDHELTIGNSIFDFPRGSTPGTCLHTVFEKVDFNHNENHTYEIDIALRNAAIGIQQDQDRGSIWQDTIEKLVDDVLSTALDGEKLILNGIQPQQRLTEMEFIFPVQHLSAPLVNKHIAKHDPISAQALPLSFTQMSGMLKGFIDLTFCYQGKYYILDWKSNFLGSCVHDYSQTAMQQAMLEHRYDFQYQLYSLALHKFLASRIADYEYQKHFGGVYYLFLRGIEPSTDNGVFYTKPSLELIEGLDTLMLS